MSTWISKIPVIGALGAFALALFQPSCGGSVTTHPQGVEGSKQALGGAYCAGVEGAFCDDFSDGDTVGWTSRGGTWGVVTDSDRVLKQSASSSPGLITVDATSGFTDQTVQASMKVMQFGGATTAYRAGIVARYQSTSNAYAFALSGAGSLMLYKGSTALTGTGCSAVASGLSNLWTWNMLKMEVSGSTSVTIRTYLNGRQIHNCVTTSGPIASGNSGAYTYGSNTYAEFDQYTVNLTRAGACDNGNGTPKAAGTVCRPVVGVCDVAETCNGTALVCPADGYLQSSRVCRSAVGPCDVAETCTGTSALCPSDQFQPPTYVCRVSTGGCDPAETCDGVSTQCPADGRITVPGTPSGLVATAGNMKVSLAWDTVPGATSYNIKRGTAISGPYDLLANAMGASYQDVGRSIGTSYYYVVSAKNGCGESAYSSEVVATPTGAPVNPVTVSVTLPRGLSLDSVGVAANGTLEIKDRATVKTPDGKVAPVANAGGGQTGIGVVATTGDVASVGSVFLRDRTQIFGNVVTAGNVARQNLVVVSGTVTENASDLTPLKVQTWTTVFPGSTLGDVILAENEVRSIDPGSYSNVTANWKANLHLRSGTYHFASFDIEWDAKLGLDTSNGPVIVYVTDALAFKGNQVNEGGSLDNFMVVYLGATPAVMERSFTGVIVAPSASVALNSSSSGYRGRFYARDLEIRPDNNVVVTSFPWSTVFEGGGCAGSIADTDHDGVKDCEDGCPYDPNKIAPGVCNCSISDKDSDLDGAPDCIDECPDDPEKITKGQCGCRLAGGLQPAGTPCTDKACPGGANVCDGAGRCGDVAACSPGPDCIFLQRGYKGYWFCGVTSPGARRSRTDAQNACKARGLALLRITSLWENRWVKKIIRSPLWLGANQIASSNSWRWATPEGNDGDQFWLGGPGGSRIGSLFANWGTGSPGAATCASLGEKDGLWASTACSTVLAYACEYPPQLGDHTPEKTPVADQPPPAKSACVDEATAQLPTGDTPSQLEEAQRRIKDQIALADAGTYTGAASNPPEAGARCVDPAGSNSVGGGVGWGCQLTDVKNEPANGCESTEQCQKLFGDPFVCRFVPIDPDNPDCFPTPGAPPRTGTCEGRPRCGVLDCEDIKNETCDEVELCNPTADNNPIFDPECRMDAGAFEPAALFPGGPPDAAASAEYRDDPVGQGTNHSWCRMQTQTPNAEPKASTKGADQNGRTGGSSKLKFSFVPGMEFNVEAKPLALGESNLSLHAQAGLRATVELSDFLGQNFSVDILNAVAAVDARRCSINTDKTAFQVFGLDFIDPADLPRINTDDPSSVGDTLYKASQACKEAIGQFQVWAGRAKKAFRDAQQLLEQYKEAAFYKKILSTTDLCSLIAAAGPLDNFPGGAKCYPNETPEQLINRFIYYYQGPGTGQIGRLREVAGTLANLSAQLKEALSLHGSLRFADIAHNEDRTVLSVPFAIGPIPMLLDISISARYGVAGELGLNLEFPQNLLDGAEAPPANIAHVSASVLPYASAALSAFVGAGFNLGPFHASVGLEGSVSIGEIQAPFFVGAGLEMEVLKDLRPIPDKLSAISSGFHFNIPKAFRFIASYDYGASINIYNVLSGELKARLRIKFWFFSRTWRKRIINFNGLPPLSFNLVNGGSSADISVGSNTPTRAPGKVPDEAGSTSSLEGNTTMGRSESEVPLMQLAYLAGPVVTDHELPDGGLLLPDSGAPLPSREFDPTNLEKPFYDTLCCAQPGQFCLLGDPPYPACCPNSECVIPDGGVVRLGQCKRICGGAQAECGQDSDCCEGHYCDGLGRCQPCKTQPMACGRQGECCRDHTCTSDGICIYNSIP